jgi:hypothetical protein
MARRRLSRIVVDILNWSVVPVGRGVADVGVSILREKSDRLCEVCELLLIPGVRDEVEHDVILRKAMTYTFMILRTRASL